ncbi:MAG TPA: peptidase S8 [Eubacterium sp.]|nr:peptidase S8 [Eubacterium sp.]HAZ85531.1 peptidase S8 [Eubacterium sp.]
MSGQGNSQKLANDLNLALDMGYERVAADSGLYTGYDSGSNTWELIVKYTGDIQSVAKRYGASAVVLLGGYAIVTLPQEHINEFADCAEVVYIEKPHRLFFSDRQALERSCVYYAWSEPYSLSGEGVLAAVIDSGIDWKNTDFRNSDGSTRILKLWDQTVAPESSGYAPPEGYVVGTEYNRDVINLALSGDEAALRSMNLSRDYSGHGTFVTGIAAGNGQGMAGSFRGVAFESELIIVKLGDSEQRQFPRTTRLMEAVNYCIMEAQKAGKPVVINMSFGNNQGSHDGTDLLSTYLNAASDVWKNVIVCGSGNEAGSGIHASGMLSGRQTESVELAVGEYESGFNLQLWKNYSDEYGVELIAPSGERSGNLRTYGADRVSLDNTQVYVYYGQPTPYSRYQQLYFEFVPAGGYVTPGVWRIVMTPVRIVDGRYDLWLQESATLNEDTRFFSPSEETTLTVPSAAGKVITVGAYNSRTDAYADFSGRGYTRTNDNIKPDIVAPGVNIVSTAVNGGYTVRSGTSMAVPFVSGSAALLMQWGIVKRNDPYLYGEKVKAYLIRTARHLPGEPVPSKRTGWGALCLRNVFGTGV